MIAGSSDDIDAKKADITLKFEEKVPVRLIPKDGASFDFQRRAGVVHAESVHDGDGERSLLCEGCCTAGSEEAAAVHHKASRAITDLALNIKGSPRGLPFVFGDETPADVSMANLSRPRPSRRTDATAKPEHPLAQD